MSSRSPASRVERLGCSSDSLQGFVEELEQRGQLVLAGLGRQLYHRRPGVLDAGAEGFGGPYFGGGRVVELVGEAGREGAEGNQFFPLADEGVSVRQPQEHSVEQVHRHREPGLQEIGEIVGRQFEQPRVPHGAEAGGPGLGPRHVMNARMTPAYEPG